MEQSSTSHPNNKKRYLLAKASNRIFSRLIDSFFVVSVCIALGVVVLNGDPKGISNANDLQDHWRYIVIGVITAICFFCYFIVLPFCWSGRTLAMFLLKLRIYNLISTKSFFINLIKRELFLWVINVLAILILSVGLASSNEPKLIFDSFFTFSSNSDQIIVIIVQAMQMIGMLLIVFVIINMCVFNRKRCIIDHASDTCVIKFVDVNSKEANDSINALNRDKGPQRKYRLPGEITTEINDEIDSL